MIANDPDFFRKSLLCEESCPVLIVGIVFMTVDTRLYDILDFLGNSKIEPTVRSIVFHL
ncbi:hypothetical protein A33Q_1033 [Indibacter alkaliphilus LW1]|uniref:Uncharacterized protein n=1 Tax=Indibacter alkaliphilus (strain CCUG 57479 / KCTC 22604 / LW1) TaxID=1189612 RepID=S2DHB0_INDAL|nr:hypothetical protein A33Q_1033 [Indibacter alkaliphilus LW1]